MQPTARARPRLTAFALVTSLWGAACVDTTAPTRATAMRITPSTVHLEAGLTVEVKADVLDEDGNVLQERADLIEWSAANPEVAALEGSGATVSVTGLGPGPARIRAEHSIFTEEAEVWVQPEGLDRIEIDPPSATIPVGGFTTFSARLFDAAGDELDVGLFYNFWSVADTTVASFRSFQTRYPQIRVRAWRVGRTRVRLRTGTKAVSAEVTVVAASNE